MKTTAGELINRLRIQVRTAKEAGLRCREVVMTPEDEQLMRKSINPDQDENERQGKLVFQDMPVRIGSTTRVVAF